MEQHAPKRHSLRERNQFLVAPWKISITWLWGQLSSLRRARPTVSDYNEYWWQHADIQTSPKQLYQSGSLIQLWKRSIFCGRVFNLREIDQIAVCLWADNWHIKMFLLWLHRVYNQIEQSECIFWESHCQLYPTHVWQEGLWRFGRWTANETSVKLDRRRTVELGEANQKLVELDTQALYDERVGTSNKLYADGVVIGECQEFGWSHRL